VLTAAPGESWRVLVGGDDVDTRLLTLASPVASINLAGGGENAAVNTVSAIAVSADGRRAAAGTATGSLRSWELGSESSPGSEVRGHPGATVRSLALDEKGEIGASVGDDGVLRLWALPGWKRLDVLDFGDSQEKPRSAAFAGKRLLVGLTGGQILRYAVR
jgi:WD40 repeat protein